MSTDLHHEVEGERRKAGLCAAYGCPFPGTSSNSTTGTDDWWCSMHNSSEPGRAQVITAELRRHPWLVNAIVDCKRYRKGAPEWPNVYARIYGDIAEAKRPDLQWNGTESRMLWTMRLETALVGIIREVADRREPQLPGVGQQGTVAAYEFAFPA